MSRTRIRNQYLLMLLSTISRLGRHGVSAKLLVEVCQAEGVSTDDIFFMHFDVLFEYGFLVSTDNGSGIGLGSGSGSGFGNTRKLLSMSALLEDTEALDMLLSITLTGTQFLERYR